MTCIVAVEGLDGAWLGADSFLGTAFTMDTLARPKLFRRHDLVFGFAGDVRGAQVAQFSAKWRKPHKREDAEEYLVTVVATAIRGAHKRHESAVKARDNDTLYLLGFRGAVYTLQTDYSVVRMSHGYAAIGAGEDVALGSLASTGDKPARERCTIALEAAARHCPLVRGRFFYELAKP